ncbi:MAG: hypothetical protein EA422_06430 [Gemmatimonadales bacterium]|nr:MAG: hypothetical protein EA422_06430 [Gemmatimonadales bacterium]
MNMAATGLLAATLAVVAVPVLPAEAQEAHWLHVRVEEPGETRVSVNLPLALVEIGLDIADRHVMQEQETRWGPEGKVTVADLRRMWAELEAVGDADFVEIEDGDTQVHISRRGDQVLMRVDEGDGTRVRMEMPSAVVQTMLGTEGDKLNLRDAVRELARSGSQDILSVQDGETTVRIWIGTNGEAR